MKKKYIIFLLIVVLAKIANAQSYNVSGINIGDKVPDVLVQNLKNYQSKSIKLSELKGKLIILDFWNKYCASCIEAFPKMERIQERFNEKIQIILVTKNTDLELTDLYKRSENIRNNRLPLITNDSILNKLFPHRAEPYHVWIDSNLQVFATTGGLSTTEGNVEKYLMGINPGLKNRVDNLDEADITKVSLLEQLLIGDQIKQLSSYSLITKGTGGTPKSGRGLRMENGKMVGYWRLNQPLVYMFSEVFANGDMNIERYFDKVIVNVKDPSHINKYFPPVNEDERSNWKSDVDNQYSYEIKFSPEVLKLPKSEMKKRSWEIVQKDLQNHFSLKVSYEKRKEKCLVLTSDVDHLRRISSKGEGVSKKNGELLSLRNIPIDSLVANYKRLFLVTENMPFVNGIGEKINIDVDLKMPEGGKIHEVIRELSKYGFEFKEAEREITCLVLTEI